MPWIFINRFACAEENCPRESEWAVAGPHAMQLYCTQHAEAYIGLAKTAGWNVDCFALISWEAAKRRERENRLHERRRR